MALSNKNWPYIIGLAGAAALAYLWLAPKLIKTGSGPAMHMAAPMHRSYPAMMLPARGMINPIRNTNLVGESGGTIPVGGGPAGVTGGGGDFGFPSGVRGIPGGYGISGGYLGEAGGSARLAVA